MVEIDHQHLCKFQTEMKISAPLPMGYPAGSPFSPGGSTSSASERLIRMGGCGYMRRDSARAALTYGSCLMSSRSACIFGGFSKTRDLRVS